MNAEEKMLEDRLLNWGRWNQDPKRQGRSPLCAFMEVVPDDDKDNDRLSNGMTDRLRWMSAMPFLCKGRGNDSRLHQSATERRRWLSGWHTLTTCLLWT